MAASVNKVIIVGRLGRDPDVRTFASGGKIVNLRIATSENWKDKQTGERKERTEWHSVTLHAEHSAKYAEQYASKGDLVYVEGQLETRKWQDQSGADRYTTEVVVRPYTGEFQIMQSTGNGQPGSRSRDDESRGDGQDQGGGVRSRSDLDDEIPF